MNLSFRLGKIPVRILPSFFITTVLLNFALAQAEPLRLVAWAAIVLASVLVHELGHAAAVLAFGLQPRIDLHGFGGSTSWSGGERLSYANRIVISLAGPAMGFLAAGLVFALHSRFSPTTPMGAYVYDSVLFANVGWGAFNLLPMLPLDGGSAMSSALDVVTKGRGERPARVVSLVIAGLTAGLAGIGTLLGALGSPWWIALLGFMFVNVNWRGLRELKSREHDAPMRAALEQAYAALEAKDGERILTLARPVALGSQTAPVRAEALQLLAFGFLLEGRLADADAAIAALPRGFTPHPSLLAMRAGVSGTPPAR
jgi:Zn-dependent protease